MYKTIMRIALKFDPIKRCAIIKLKIYSLAQLFVIKAVYSLHLFSFLIKCKENFDWIIIRSYIILINLSRE